MVSSKNNDKNSLFVVLIVCVVALVAVIGIISSNKMNYLNGSDLDSDVNIGGEAFSAKNLDSSLGIVKDKEVPLNDLEPSSSLMKKGEAVKFDNYNDWEEFYEKRGYADNDFEFDDNKPIFSIDLVRTKVPKPLRGENNILEDPANKYEYEVGEDFFSNLIITNNGFAYLSLSYGTIILTEDIDFPYTLVLEGTSGNLIFDCNGHEINGINFENENPVLLAQQNVIMKNCKVTNRMIGYELNTNSRIETSTFDHVKYGAVLNDNSEADGCYVNGQVFLDEDEWVGFVLRDSSSIVNSNIKNINIYQNAHTYVETLIGFYIADFSENVVLRNNSIHDLHLEFENLEEFYGFFGQSVTNGLLDSNSIFNVNVQFMSDSEFYFWGGIYVLYSDGFMIENSKIYSNSVNFHHFNYNSWIGIGAWTDSLIMLDNNKIYNNEFDIDSPYPLREDIIGNRFHGIDGSHIQITNNEIRDNVVSSFFNYYIEIQENYAFINSNDAMGITAQNSVLNYNVVRNNLDHVVGIAMSNSTGHNNYASYNKLGIQLYGDSYLYESWANHNYWEGIMSYASMLEHCEANNNAVGIYADDESYVLNSHFNYNEWIGANLWQSFGFDLEANHNGIIGFIVGSFDEDIIDYNLVDSHAYYNNNDGLLSFYFAKSYNIDSNFNWRGFELQDYSLVENSRAYANSEHGFYLNAWELCEDFPPVQVRNCVSDYNGETGFYAEFGGLVNNSISRNNNESGFVLQGLSSAVDCKSYLNGAEGYVLEENATVNDSSASINEGVGFVLSDFSFVSNSLAKGNFGGGFVLNNNASSFGIEALQNQGNGIVFNDDTTGFISEAYNNSIGSHIEPNATITHSRFCDNSLDFDANFGTTKIELVATSTQGRWYGVKNLPCECEVICPPQYIMTNEECYGTPYYFFNFINIEEKKNVCCIPEGFILKVTDPENCEIELVHVN